MTILFSIIAAAAAAMVIHEGGHYLATRCFGKTLKFRFEWGYIRKIPVPRFTWSMPILSYSRQKIIALAGFGMEFAFIPIFYALAPAFCPWYAAIAALHTGLYRFYAGANSDFNWL